MSSRQLTRIAICTALICVASYITFPLPFTPALVTAQTLVINIIGLTLKPKEAFASVGMYIFMGLIGLPVFAGGTSGIGKILGPAGGYYIGFWVAPVIMSLLKCKVISLKRYLSLTIGVGIPIIYILGALFMSLYQKVGFGEVLVVSVLPFIVGDILKCIGASYMSVALNRMLLMISDVKSI